MEKNILRSELLQSLNALPLNEIQSLSDSVTNQIIKFLKMHPELMNKIGAGFLPLKAEIAPMELPVQLAYPVLREGLMSFGVPDGSAMGSIWLKAPYVEVKPEWLLIPGLGFDLSGRRLGRGKGFYDRYLENSKALKIGIAWSRQLKEKIPVDSHDCHMDFIITENFCWDVHQQVKV